MYQRVVSNKDAKQSFILTSFLVLRNLNVFRLPAFCLCNLFALAWSDATPMASLLPTDVGAMLLTPPTSESATSTKHYSEKWHHSSLNWNLMIIYFLYWQSWIYFQSNTYFAFQCEFYPWRSVVGGEDFALKLYSCDIILALMRLLEI